MPKIRWKTVLGHLAWLLFWAGFYLVWGRWLWTTAEFGSPEWMRDNYGHALAGAALALESIYAIRSFSPDYFLVHKKLILNFLVPFGVVLSLAVLWEAAETLYDWVIEGSAWIPAQKGGADTTIDIVLTLLWGLVGVRLYAWYERFASDPDAGKIEEFRARAEANRDERKELKREVRAYLRSRPTLLTKVKEFLDSDDGREE